MKILAIGDPHFRSKNVSDTNQLYDGVVKLLDQAETDGETFDLVVVLGDIHHDHSKINSTCQVRATKFLKGLADLVPTYALVGNHDIPNNECFLTEIHSLYPLKGSHPQLVIVDQPLQVNIQGYELVFCPYIPVGRFIEALNRCPNWKSAKIVFAHQEVHNVLIGASTRSTSSDKWEADYPFLVCGHMHMYQHLAANTLYTGTPYSTNFGEIDPKSISIITLTDDEVNHVRHDLQLAKHFTVDFGVEDIEGMEVLLTYNYPPSTKLKLRLTGTSQQHKTFIKQPIYKQLKKAYDLTLEKIIIDPREPVVISSGGSLADKFTDHLTRIGRHDLIVPFRKICVD
jgi:DNA repair exonuclease SbcCD nuclease subunit